MKELQRTVCLAAYESLAGLLFGRPGAQPLTKKNSEMLRKSILGLGNPNEVTLPQQMVLGLNQFGHLCEYVPVMIKNNDQDMQSVGTSAGDGGLMSRT